MGRRIGLFLLTNILVLVTISIVTSLLGVNHYITDAGLNYESLLIFCGIWGMGGSFISLLLSKKMAKMAMRIQIIDPSTTDPQARELVQTVHRLAKAANLPKMPEVGYYNSPEVNAFATGPSKSNSLVAVSAGLLNQMDRGQVEGVLGHEVAHIANGDMVTMTLIQGVVNAFAMFLSRIVAFAASQFLQGDDEEGPSIWLQYGLIFLFDILFTFLGSFVVAYFSRQREFRADKGGAQLAGRDKMIGALQSLQANIGRATVSQNDQLATMKISGSQNKFLALLLSHPPLEKRIERLKTYT